MTVPPIPVGVRLPLPTPDLPPADVLQLCRAAVEMGYGSFWIGDHVMLPEASDSVYPHTETGARPFSAETPWADPLLQLTWLAGQLPNVRLGTSVIVMTLRNPRLLAKQIATMSWLTGAPISLGVGTGWLRDEYDAVGMPFEGRATRARADLAEIKELLAEGRRDYTVRDDAAGEVTKSFRMLPRPTSEVEFLWGGFSPLAMRIIASSCDGWLPAKQSLEALETLHLPRLRAACEAAGRDFEELRLVVKPGSGPDPASGRIDRANLEAYAALGFHEAILEMPLSGGGVDHTIGVLERVARRSWL